MIDELSAHVRQHSDMVRALLQRCFARGRPFLGQVELRQMFAAVSRKREDSSSESTPLGRFAAQFQEGVFQSPWAYFALRRGVGDWLYLRFHAERIVPEPVTASGFLRFKERLVAHPEGQGPVVEVDFSSFDRSRPRLEEPRAIGQGAMYLNRWLAGRTQEGGLLEFLRTRTMDGAPLMISEGFPAPASLRAALGRALELLAQVPPDTSWPQLAARLAELGFAPGWGDTAGRAAETMNLLADILDAPSPSALETFFARIPMVSRVLALSPHGYFGQQGVLGLPDTGGQVVYILDQVRALEREMTERLARQGVAGEPKILIVTRLIPDAQGTGCDRRLEQVSGCDNVWILRVPFRRENGEVVRHWLPRFEVWPYLEEFAREAEREALAELGGRPDLVIGNYSDGNLVATLLSQQLGVIQCNIAHALEKAKYPDSDVYWQERDAEYHFSCQYTADLVAMNAADFIVTSSYQEIAGTNDTMGQYEHYQTFTLPGLYRVMDGIDLFDPKFNIVPPGVDETVYFPYRDRERRRADLLPEIESLVYGPAGSDARGQLADRDKPLVFTMARLDPVKNLTGLVEWFGSSKQLRKHANLLIVGGCLDPAVSSDQEEREEIRRLHGLMDRHGLDRQVRWLGMRLDRTLAGELYRHVADRRGIFVQPARFEAFGLTLIEAMASGLPAFATSHGGPQEIIQHNRSGFQFDPEDGNAVAEMIADFLERSAADPLEWERLSEGAIDRVAARYTWRRYAERMMTLSGIYGFRRLAGGPGQADAARYLRMFYQLQFRPLATRLCRQH